MEKLKSKLKEFFAKKNNRITTIAVVGVILIVLIVALVVGKNKNNKFALNEIYDVFPEEVRELYANMVSVSCYGDLHFNVVLDAEATKVSELSKNNLIDYMLSYLDKNEKLTDEFEVKLLKDATSELFAGELDLTEQFTSYGYGDYTYTLENGMVTRKKQECTSDKQYITHLYGYSWNEKELSIDVNIGYLKDDVLYDLQDNKLGEYNGELSELADLFGPNSYYRLNYVKNDKRFKLNSVELNSRS